MQNSPESSGGLRDELRGDAQSVAGSAKDRVHSEMDARKGGAANQVKSLSSALDTAADELGQDSPAWLRSIFQQGAQTLQRFADTVEQKDSRELTRDVQQMAREHPGTFLTGCALAGFAAARVFRAGADDASMRGSSGDYSSGESNAYDPYATSGAGGTNPATAYSSGSAGYTATPTTGGTT